MKVLLSLALLAVLAAAARAQTSPDFEGDVRSQVDAIRLLRAIPNGRPGPAIALAGQIPPARAEFDQGELNVCHDVAALTVVEAALFRFTGDRVVLSSADLFLRNTLMRRAPGAAAGESDSMLGDIEFALSQGVAAESAVPYKKFLPAYQELKASPDGALAERRSAWAERFVSRQDSWWPGKIARQRRATRDALKGFRTSRWLLPSAKMARFNPHALSKADCLAEGREQEKFLLSHLASGRPVAVGFDAAGLPGPAHDAAGVTGHAAVIDGVRLEGGKPVFTTMHAWGNVFREDQLCRIDEMGAVLTPNDLP